MRRSAAVPVSLDKSIPTLQSRKQTRHLLTLAYLGSEVHHAADFPLFRLVNRSVLDPFHRYTGGAPSRIRPGGGGRRLVGQGYAPAWAPNCRTAKVSGPGEGKPWPLCSILSFSPSA